MYTIDKEEAHKILTTELNYSPTEAALFLEDFPEIHDKLADAVKSWLENKTFEDVSIDGISIKEVMKIHKYNFLLAVRTLNGLLDEDITPEFRQGMAERLKKPFPIK